MDLKDLEKLIKMLRKHGVLTFKGPQVELSLGDLPSPMHRGLAKALETSSPIIGDAPIQTEELSAEDALFWSSTSV